jgi:hypothetical protein
MPSRYIIQAHPGGRYSIWDSEKNVVATSPNGDRQYDNLGMNEAFDLRDKLDQPDAPIPPSPEPPQQATQQQQQPQPDKKE